MKVEVSPNSANLFTVIQQNEIPFRRSIKLPDLDVSKPVDEILPNLGPEPVTHCNSHFVAPIIVLLSGEENGRELRFLISGDFSLADILGAETYWTYLRCVAEIPHNFTDVLDDGDVIFSAVVPELGC